MRNATKVETSALITYTIPAQDTLTGPCVIIVRKTTDGSLSVDYTVDASFGSVSWQQFVAQMEADFNVTIGQ